MASRYSVIREYFDLKLLPWILLLFHADLNDYLQQKYLNWSMSITRPTEISLSELVKESNLILQVKFIKIFNETIPVIDKSSDQTGKPIPPFIKKGCVFKVLGVLKNTAHITVPENIPIPNENWHRSLNRHKEIYAGGKQKSYNVPTYRTEVSSLRKAFIVFLHHFQGMFDLAAKDAFEDHAAEEKIKMLLEN